MAPEGRGRKTKNQAKARENQVGAVSELMEENILTKKASGEP